MSQLFDIAHAKWERITSIPEDREFLIDRRGPRQMSMTTEDMVFRHAAAKYQKRKQEEERRRLRHKEESTLMAAAVVLSSDDSSDDNSASEASTSYEPDRQSNSTVSKRPLSESTQPLPSGPSVASLMIYSSMQLWTEPRQ